MSNPYGLTLESLTTANSGPLVPPVPEQPPLIWKNNGDHAGWSVVKSAPIFTLYIDALSDVSREDHAKAVDICREARANRRRFFFVGNGGSAAIASHMAADYLKAARVAAMAFNDGPQITCLSNDLGYDQVFSWPLRLHASPKDVLFAISSSGRSQSIISAADMAASVGMSVITLSAFKPDNRLRSLGHVNFYVPSERYGIVEVAHHAICHSILDAVVG